MHRRRFIATGLGAAATLGVATTIAAAARGSPAPGKLATPAARVAAGLRGPALLDAFVRLRGRTDGRLVYGWLKSTRSTVVGGDVAPLCGVLAGAVQRFERIAEDTWEATLLEVAHYTDPVTGELLRTVRMPATGREVAVPSYRFGPVRARFAVALDEWEEFDLPQGGSNAAAFVPKSSVRLVRSIGPATALGTAVAVRAEEYGRVYPDRARPHTVWYREWMNWRAESAALADRTTPWVAADYGYTALTSWRPWMQMGDVGGHTVDSGVGAKALDWSGCPAEFLELTRRLHPDVLDDPERALRSPPK